MASSIQLLRSTIAQERPFPANLLEGQPAININASEPGLFFKASDGSMVKVGPATITSDGSPPNSSPAGFIGNTVGELWFDASTEPGVLKIFNGVEWKEAGSGGGGGGGGTGEYLRWVYTSSTGGETSLSGTSGGVSLSYTPGLEEVYINGVLIARSQDYSATTGSSITNLSPLVAGDVVTVISLNPVETVQLPGTASLLRWYKLAVPGEEVLNGNDDGGQSLVYEPGFEQVFVNGVLLRRGGDYTATDGSNITLASTLTGGDEVTVLAFSEILLGAITTSDIQDGAITEPKIADGDITNAKLALNSVATANVQGGAITSNEIAAETIVDGDISPAAGISSGKIDFTAEGGGITRTLASLLDDTVNVKNFGALGDGSDQTNEIQAAFDEAKARDVPLYFPPGQYLITSTVDAQRVSFYGTPGAKSWILCGCPTGVPTIDNIGAFVKNLRISGDGGGGRDGIRGFRYKNYILGCYFNGLETAVIADGIIVASVIEDTEFLGCETAISDKAHDGSRAHTTLWVSDSIIHYGGKAFDLKTQAAGFFIRGCVFEDLEYVFYCRYLFDSTFSKCWVEQVFRDCTVFEIAYGGSPSMTNTFENFSLRSGPRTIFDADKISAGSQVALTGFNLGGGARFDEGALKIASTQSYGFIFYNEGIKPAALQANFTDPGDLKFDTMSANSNKTSPGGDVLFNTGSGSNGSRRGAVLPADDNSITLGIASNRWKEVYAGAPSINTSDARLKEQERDVSDAERAVAIKAKKLLKAFKFKDAVEKKGDGARIHFGVYAQELAEAFASEGLNAEDYAMFCYDEWDEKRDENGEIIRLAGDSYGVRYEELLAFIISAL